MKDNFNDNQVNYIPVDFELDEKLIAQQQAEIDIEIDVVDLLKELKLESRRDERIISFYLVYAVDRSDYTTSLESVTDNYSRGYNLVVPKKSYAFQLAQGTVKDRESSDDKIKPFLKNWRLERLGCCTHIILRMAMWELNQENAIPSIIINEAVELAKIFAEKDAFKFVNGILDEYCRHAGISSLNNAEN